MIYLDNGATSFHKPPEVARAMVRAMRRCANPGRGGYPAAMTAAEVVYACRVEAGKLFDCAAEQVCFTGNCTQGLNIAIRSLVKSGDPVVVSGFEHNAVMRTLHHIGARVQVAGRRLFDRADTIAQFREKLDEGAKAAVFTHVSNVFGYILPVAELAQLCREREIPFVLDAAQSAGILPVSLRSLGAAYIAMPGHKGLLGPQGTGLLLCAQKPQVLIAGGTGSESKSAQMPSFLPDRLEAGTQNVPGIAGLCAAMRYVQRVGTDRIFRPQQHCAAKCAAMLRECGFRVFSGPDQAGTVSFVPQTDCEVLAQQLADAGIAVRAGLHCAPLAHESAGTIATGTVRVSFGHDASVYQVDALANAIRCRKI